MATCEGRGGCGAPIEWRVNDKTNKSAPVNQLPDPTGNVTLPDDTHYHVLTKAELHAFDERSFFDGDEPVRYTLHFATCPNADKFRRRDAKAHREKRTR